MPDMGGITALHLAVQASSRLLVELLLRFGADPAARDAHGFSAAGVCVWGEGGGDGGKGRFRC